MSKYAYQSPDTNQTLQMGLDEYYKNHPDFVDSDGFLGQEASVVKAHDAAHVFFGLGPTSAEELLVEVMTVLGCKLPPKKMTNIVKKGFIGKVVGHFGIWRLTKRLLTTLPRVIRAAYRAVRMKKKWPHFDYEQYLGRPLKDLREEFGIKVGL